MLGPTLTVPLGGGTLTTSATLGADVDSSYPLSPSVGWASEEGDTSGADATVTTAVVCTG